MIKVVQQSKDATTAVVALEHLNKIQQMEVAQRLVNVCVIDKAWASGMKKLHIVVRNAEESFLFEVVSKKMLLQENAEYKGGTPPRGNLERQIQFWLDESAD